MSRYQKKDEPGVSSEELERRHFQHVIDTFSSYKLHSKEQVLRKIESLSTLPQHHQQMVPNLVARLQEMPNAIEANQTFINKILHFTDGMFLNSDVTGSNEKPQKVTADDMDRVRTTLKQCVRDWSDEGKKEREETYNRILEKLRELYPKDKFNYQNIEVLVPGAGLGRLMLEIALMGFSCQGNEFSLYMLFASNYILNMCDKTYGETIYPWVHQTSNVVSNDDQLREVKIPDINPQLVSSNLQFSMAAGDFLEVYIEPNSWDCVVTCYFLDTAHNIIDYIERVHHILKPGGYFINLGPLLYHFSDSKTEVSIELTYEELKTIMLDKFKFKVVKEEMNVKSTYIKNIRSMFSTVYDCVFFVLQKIDDNRIST